MTFDTKLSTSSVDKEMSSATIQIFPIGIKGRKQFQQQILICGSMD